MSDTQDTQPDIPEKPKRKISNVELDTVKNYLIIDLAYDFSVCLPYKDGVALLASLENAENVSVDRYGNSAVKFIAKKMIVNSHIISQLEYRTSKMNQLLGVDNE